MREKELERALLWMVLQYCTSDGKMYHSFMSAGEEAFSVLGIDLDTKVEEVEARAEKLDEELEP